MEQFESYRQFGLQSHVINFVERCTELCWSMAIKQPPMVLVYDQLEGRPHDRTLFSTYTKNGPVIDFVVWPALLLHNNGPILQKGSVQGKATTSTGESSTFIVRNSIKGNDNIQVFIPKDDTNQSVKVKGRRNDQ